MSDIHAEAERTPARSAPAHPDAAGLRCPACGGALAGAETLACEGCGASYAFRDGIYDLRLHRHDYYFNPVPRPKMHALVDEAAVRPWDDTVRGFLAHTRNVGSWIDNIAVNGRYTWKLFLDLAPGARFLDFGCGLGNMTQNIAPHVAEVVALDLTWERLLFARERFAQFNPDQRITLVAGGDGRHLPFPDAHFDCVALSGVLEWIADDSSLYDSAGSRATKALRMLASFFGETNPRRTQLRFLRELRRIVKPGGQLFVAIENRWNHEYFTGRPDHHSGLKYGSLLPRGIANLYSIARRRQPYRTYTYALPEFRRLFASAGFPRQACLGLTPGYSSLAEVIPVDAPPPFWRAGATSTLKERIRRHRLFVPAFGMIAQASGNASASLLARLLAHLEAERPALAPIEIAACVISGKDKVVLRGTARGEPCILRLPAGRQAEEDESRAWFMLEQLAARPALADRVPRPIVRGAFQRIGYFLESAVAGEPLSKAQRSLSRALLAGMVGDFLRVLHAPGATHVPLVPGSASFSALVGEPIARMRRAGVEPLRCASLEKALAARLAGRDWPVGLQHGDFGVHNLFTDNARISGLIDWEYATAQGLPALDAVNYLESMQRLASPSSSLKENVARLAKWDWPCAEELDMLRAFYRQLAIDPACHPLLCDLAWLGHLGRQLATTARFDPRFFDHRLAPMLEALEAA